MVEKTGAWGLDRREIEDAFLNQCPASRDLLERARRVMPGGDTRQQAVGRPSPVYVRRAVGASIEDVDGNEYVDGTNGWSAVILGHAHPAVTAAVADASAQGALYTGMTGRVVELAEALVARVPSIETVRLTNTGTEAVLLAVRAARAFTGRSTLVTLAGGYHAAIDLPEMGTFGPGAMHDVAAPSIAIPLDDLDSIDSLPWSDVAAVLVEPVLGAAGSFPVAPEMLRALRDHTLQEGALLVFDEVTTFRLAPGGAQERLGVVPDLTALGKVLGNGLAIGAVGGRADVMDAFSPARRPRVRHSGTFTANPVSVGAALAVLPLVDRPLVEHIDGLGERFSRGIAKVAARTGQPITVTGLGSLRNLHVGTTPPEAPEAGADETEDLWLLSLGLATRGHLVSERGYLAFSAAMTERHVDGFLAAIEDVLTCT
jgi:glutamate-1-semialdehyde 2,1-aminomutase